MKRAALAAVAVALMTAGCGGSHAPSIAIMSPGQGPAGTIVTLEGSGLDHARAVTFGGVPALFSDISERKLLARVPPNAKTGSVGLVTSHGSTKTSVQFVVAGTELPGTRGRPPANAPTIASVYPTSASPGELVDVRGSGLGATRTVRFGDARAEFQVAGDGDLRAVVPPKAVSGALVLSGPGGDAQVPFTVVALH